MKKIILAILLSVCAVMLLAGCGKKGDNTSKEQITVKKYKGLEIEEVAAMEVTDEDVEASIRTDLASLNKNTTLTEGQAIMGDTVTIDYAGKIDGEAFEGGTDTGHELMLGSNSFIDGFEEGVVGHSVGETFDLNLKFPETYHSAEVAGKDVVFTVTIKSISRLPELTVEILPELGTTATTIEDYKKSVRENLKKNNEETRQIALRNAVIEALAKQCEVKNYPEDKLIKSTTDFIFEESYGAIMNNSGIEAYVVQSHGMTVEEKVKELVKTELAVAYVAEKENIVVTKEEYDAEVKKLAESYGETDVDAFITSFEMVYGEGYIEYNLLKDEVADFLVKHCKQVKAK